MAGSSKKSSPTEASSSSLADLAGLLGRNSLLDPGGIHAALWWMAMVTLLNSGASLQVGMNKAKSSVILTLYDGDYPFKQFLETVDDVNFTLAAVIKSYTKGKMPPEWQEVVDQYFRKP